MIDDAQGAVLQFSTLEFWGSDCRECEGNTSPGSMECDYCGSTNTVALYTKKVIYP